EVVHDGLGERYALKLLHTEASRDAEALARFANEARIAARLRSEHLVRVTDTGQLPTGEPFLVMDYLEGTDLERVVEQGSVPVPTAVSWVLQACAGLAALHAEGLVHRDIKPSNLFLSRERDGRQVLKILDFGIAKVTGPGDTRLTSTRATFGTPAFMAPEQVVSAKNVDARCDQHAIALVLFELLTGRSAFEGETAGAISVAIATQLAPRVSRFRADVPRPLEDAVARALSKRPADRYPSIAQLAREIAPFGGADAGPLLAAIERTLAATPLPAATTGGQLPPADAHASVRTGDITVSPTTSRRAQGERRSPATLWFILAAALVGVGAGLGLTLVLVRSNAPATESTVGLAAERGAPTANTSASPPPSAEPATRPDVAVEPVSSASAAPSASAPAASPSAVPAPRTAKPKPSAAPSSTGKPSILDSYTPPKR
ncbi:MAG: protein kinase, partial [Myxococcales bacterium]|nr:protein kinase [Myxococcales bacterium]